MSEQTNAAVKAATSQVKEPVKVGEPSPSDRAAIVKAMDSFYDQYWGPDGIAATEAKLQQKRETASNLFMPIVKLAVERGGNDIRYVVAHFNSIVGFGEVHIQKKDAEARKVNTYRKMTEILPSWANVKSGALRSLAQGIDINARLPKEEGGTLKFSTLYEFINASKPKGGADGGAGRGNDNATSGTAKLMALSLAATREEARNALNHLSRTVSERTDEGQLAAVALIEACTLSVSMLPKADTGRKVSTGIKPEELPGKPLATPPEVTDETPAARKERAKRGGTRGAKTL